VLQGYKGLSKIRPVKGLSKIRPVTGYKGLSKIRPGKGLSKARPVKGLSKSLNVKRLIKTGLMGILKRSCKAGSFHDSDYAKGNKALFFFGSEKFFFSKQAMIDISTKPVKQV
jgi:hypothetical protein